MRPLDVWLPQHVPSDDVGYVRVTSIVIRCILSTVERKSASLQPLVEPGTFAGSPPAGMAQPPGARQGSGAKGPPSHV